MLNLTQTHFVKKNILLILDASSGSTNPPVTNLTKEADRQPWRLKPNDACPFGGGGDTINPHLARLRDRLVLKLLAAKRNGS